ncbi:glycosyltransferase [Leucobacter chromiireducens]|uniref:Glycosyltransferase subfamily 4-like N-terminal domain-containing protein n=1 Tax=Leucobacter chromiireducens subsp. chromiireducens TaxID=660067 RepID=A0ABS1SPP8_9MICO|nr:glycosyltransferase [Leucobacter chromiireducens]MBL3690142.1 hypothetical protein [Leucobacter chromiireducens subsp. chromiireducens]
MRILLICPFFPPENKIASVRIAKFAEYWSAAGHEVRVLTRTADGTDLAVPEHPNLSVHRVADPFAKSASGIQKLKPAKPNRFQQLLGVAYGKALSFVWPDIYARWSRAARKEAQSWVWQPDAVVASVGPFSTLMLGSQLAKHFSAKLLVDYRDLLTLSTYYPHGAIRRRIDGSVERRVAAQAAALATVSAPLADELAETYNRPSVVVTNGYDPADFTENHYAPDSPTLRITYCGWVIPNRRDPRPFLSGVAQLLRERDDVSIAVDFYGPPSGEVSRITEELGLDAVVTQHGRVNHAESLRLQSASDVLLLLLWNDPGELGVLSGKIFEYIGAGRPILMTGLEDGAAGKLISENELGLVSNDSAAIARYLGTLADEKRETGRVAGPALKDPSEFSRDTQSQRLLDAIETAVSE